VPADKKLAKIFYPGFKNLIWHLHGPAKTIFLTFDDGPYPETTGNLLEILSQFKVPAHFFLTGKRIEEYGLNIKRLDFTHHKLGNHGYSHHPLILSSGSFLQKEISKTDRLLEDLLSSSTTLFRPPYGIWGPGLYKILKRMKKDLILWSLMSNDFKWSPQKCKQFLKKNIQPGDIVLFHDSPVSFETTSQILPDFISFCLSQGYQFRLL
jgi:peptidoglycan/xylan/chitin deacetylase (PgdA/CDA1 family)